MTIVKIALLPLSMLYGIGVGIRNFLFNIRILKSEEFSIPVICVGNITVGGTGKTPHTELLLSELQSDFRVACLSRGYKRKTSGFVLANEKSTARDIGDEPMQIKRKFPNVIVAVDEKRARGIHKLLTLPQRPEVIILDDAFQHRYVKAGKNIVLIDYNRPVFKDCLLPMGRLRETPDALKRADYLIVSKCPADLPPIERRLLAKHLRVKPYQQLFLTTMEYGGIKSLTPGQKTPTPGKDSAILCFTGIACPDPYFQHLRKYTRNITEIRFPDHYNFIDSDFRNILDTFNDIYNPEKYIFTTEKDVARLLACSLPEELKKHIYYIPIEPEFLSKKEILINELKDYVTKNKR